MKVPRKLLPMLLAFVLGGGGGFGAQFVGALTGEQKPEARSTNTDDAVAARLIALEQNRVDQSKASALLEQRVGDGFQQVRNDIADLKSEVRVLAAERRSRR